MFLGPKMSAGKIVVFDLGGVMVRVARTWDDAARRAGIPISRAEAGRSRLAELEGFEPYQARQIGLQEYLQQLRLYLGLNTTEEALSVHQGILMEPYPGTLELVDALHAHGFRTGCLSNTNAPHWALLRSPDHYPAIAALQSAMASHEVGLGKPDPAIFRTFEATFGVNASEVLFFDDHPANVAAAKACGWDAYEVDPTGDPPTFARERLNLPARCA